MTNFLKFKLNDATPLQHGTEGYGKSVNKMARDGIYKYLGMELGDQFEPNTVYNVLRRTSEVGSPESLLSYAGKPMTIGHPYDGVDVTNWDYHAVGHIGDDARIVFEDGVSYVEATNYINSDRAVGAILAGAHEISMGYDCMMDFTGGIYTAPNGEQIPYVAEQSNIRINHAALVPFGRAGNAVRIITDDDGVKRYCFGAVDKITPIDDGESPSLTDSGQPESKPKVKIKDTLMTKVRQVKIGDSPFIELDAENAALVQSAADALETTHKTQMADAASVHKTAISDAEATHKTAIANLDKAHKTALSDLETAHETATAELTTAHDEALSVKDAELVTANAKIKELEDKVLTPEAINAIILDRQTALDVAKTLGADTSNDESASVRDLKVLVIKHQDANFVATDETPDSTIDAVFAVYAKKADEQNALSGATRLSDGSTSGGTGSDTSGGAGGGNPEAQKIIDEARLSSRTARQTNNPTVKGA